MSIFGKVLEIYNEYYICTHCLGRMFSLLGSSTTNQERGYSLLLSLTMENHRNFINRNENRENFARNLKILAENAHFRPAQSVLNNEGLVYGHNDDSSCYLCNGIFSNLQPYVDEAVSNLKDYEFNNFLVGTDLDSQIINREDIFKAKFNLLEAESFKSHFNREVGKSLMTAINKPPEFANPDITIIYSLQITNFNVNFLVKSLFIYGKYNKFLRDIPQTHWNCRNCRGKGCELCDYSGKQYKISVEELVSPEFIKKAKSTTSKFHGAGREDIDAKMLGEGRPFILELKNPKVRMLNLEKIQKYVNKKNKKKVKVSNLRYSSKNEVKEVKLNSEKARKLYRALIESEKNLSKEQFNILLEKLKKSLENKIIDQKTPSRVSHRRADKIRKKKVYSIVGKYLKPSIFEFLIETQGGTYIKELISGDGGRTQPSFTEIFEFPLICKELDVLKIF
ncbi:MAG: tRNA pseudouridine(54/55) synthase Pus10 [Candidatus Heimdallarchaeota archaeon]